MLGVSPGRAHQEPVPDWREQLGLFLARKQPAGVRVALVSVGQERQKPVPLSYVLLRLDPSTTFGTQANLC